MRALDAASRYSSTEELRPSCILWTDGNREWEHLLGYLNVFFPNQILVLGDYNPEKRRGPGLWIRCVLAGLVKDFDQDQNKTPIIYIPGYSREQLRAVDSCPAELQPLAEHQYRGVFFTHENGKDWTLYSFLSNEKQGIGLSIKDDRSTKEAIRDSFRQLFDIKKSSLVGRKLDAVDFQQILVTDPGREILLWLCEGEDFVDRLDIEEKNQLSKIIGKRFSIPFEGEALYQARQNFLNAEGEWGKLWNEFLKRQSQFPTMFDSLKEILPTQDSLFNRKNFPSEILKAETQIWNRLQDIDNLHVSDAKNLLKAVYTEHKSDEKLIWVQLGYVRVYHLISLCSELIDRVDSFEMPMGEWKNFAEAYVSHFSDIDGLVLKLIKSTNHSEYPIIAKIVKKIYQPWLELINSKFTDSIKTSSRQSLLTPLPEMGKKVVRVFVDGLRFDYAKELIAKLKIDKDILIDEGWRLSSFPSVTVSGKALVQPLSDQLEGSIDAEEFTPQWKEKTTLFSKISLETHLGKSGYQVVDLGDPVTNDARGWLEVGNIDAQGHHRAVDLARRMDDYIEEILYPVRQLLASGWEEVQIVTDHGWLFLPGGLPKISLPAHAIITKWSRCALVKDITSSNLLSFPWTWNHQVYVSYPPNIHCFREGEEYAHGGISLQECVIPFYRIRKGNVGKTSVFAFKILSKKWIGLRLQLQYEGGSESFRIRIVSSLSSNPLPVSEGKSLAATGTVVLLADDEFEGKTCYLVIEGLDGKVIFSEQILIGAE
jgi:hypothetical protein